MRSNLDPRRNALCFPLDLNLTSQSVDLVGLPVLTPKPEVEIPFWNRLNGKDR